jgi:hypothetical protein
VEDVSPQPDATDSPTLVSGTGGLPVFDIGAEPGEAVGYSRAYDLGEAIREAIDKLPTQAPGIPDWLSTYTVLSIGAEIGGIAGFNHLKVRVSG